MSQFGEQPEMAARAAVELRTRLRALASAQTEAFDLLYYEFGAASPTGVVITKVATRLSYLAALLADLAWTNGERTAHDGVVPPPAPEADAVRRVFRFHASERRRFAMNSRAAHRRGGLSRRAPARGHPLHRPRGPCPERHAGARGPAVRGCRDRGPRRHLRPLNSAQSRDRGRSAPVEPLAARRLRLRRRRSAVAHTKPRPQRRNSSVERPEQGGAQQSASRAGRPAQPTSASRLAEDRGQPAERTGRP